MPQRSAILSILDSVTASCEVVGGRPLKRISHLIERLFNCSTAPRRSKTKLGAKTPALIAVIVGLFAMPAAAQIAPAPHVQLGIGVVPGIGLEAGYVSPRSFYTVEGVLYVDGSPGFAGGQGSVQISGGLGGAIRILGIMRVIGSPENVERDFDVGLRFGPSLFFTVGESSREENPFSLFLEPFLRFSSAFGEDRMYFAELGIQRPFLRAGLWFRL